MRYSNYRLLLSLMGVALICTGAIAQNKKVPPFRMALTTGHVFTAHELPMGKPIMMVYFDPTCDHCRQLTRQFLQHYNEIKKASIVMITYVTVNDLHSFVKEFNFTKYKNFYVGTEGSTFFVRDYYRVGKMPFVALYTKDGDFLNAWNQPADVAPIIRILEK